MLTSTIQTGGTPYALPPVAAITLRPYQEECIERVLTAYAQDRHSEALVVLPTAAGKTVIFSQVIYTLAETYGLNAMIVAHTDALLEQAAEKYRQVKPTAVIGKVGSGRHEYGGEVTVACIDTISRPEHLKMLERIGYGLLIIDEAHRCAAPKYQKVLQVLPNTFVLKVTATPDRLDGKPISTKPPLYSKNIIEMIEQGYLCDVRAVAIRTETNLDTLHVDGGDYREKELEAAIDTPKRNQRVVEAYSDYASERRAICFAVTVEHAQHLAAAFCEAGISAACVSGETPLEERKYLYKALHAGDIHVLTNVQVLTEGFDSPLVDCVIMARPTQSRALYIQSIGRGLRLAPLKNDCLILDLTDNCLKHRLEPQRLSKALGKPLRDGETVLESVAKEASERPLPSSTSVQHTLKDTRTADLTINIKARLDWQAKANGTFALEVGQGPEKHRILLVPDDYNRYSVFAAFAPAYERQQWLGPSTLDWAQQFAERGARKLLADEKNRVLVDRNAGWRTLPVDILSKQAFWLRAFGVVITDTMTRGEASDILERKFAEREQERARRKAEKGNKQKKVRMSE